MSYDKDDNFAISAIELLNCLLLFKMLGQDDCESICSIAIDEPQIELRRTAGQFFATMIKIETSNSMSSDGASNDNLDVSSTASSKKKSKGSSTAAKKAKAKKIAKANTNNLGGPVVYEDGLEIPSVQVSREHIKQLLFIIADRNDEAAANVVDAV